MIEALKSDDVVKKVGGRFRLAALIQRRLKELVDGARPLVDTEGKTLVEVAVKEIEEDKIAIEYEGNLSLEPPVKAAMNRQIHTSAT